MVEGLWGVAEPGAVERLRTEEWSRQKQNFSLDQGGTATKYFPLEMKGEREKVRQIWDEGEETLRRNSGTVSLCH